MAVWVTRHKPSPVERARNCIPRHWDSVALRLSYRSFVCKMAQEVTATITGVVTDPSGADVIGASVTGKSDERTLTYVQVATTLESIGLFRFRLVVTI